jgi:hypothetical protein
MHTKHREVPEPEEDVKIWRYMDLFKFEDLLSTKSLFFSRIDNFGDLFEGRSSDKFHSIFEKYKKYTCANCWNQNDYESNLMWESYIKEDQEKGIAIQSSISKLRNCFKDSECEQYIGTVIYDNSDLKPENLSLKPFFRKKKEFESEKEIRVICQKMDLLNSNPFPKEGYRVNIDLTELIENIYTSPYSLPAFITQVETMVSEFNLEVPIKKSELLYRDNDSKNKNNDNDENNNLEYEIRMEPNDSNCRDSSGNFFVENVCVDNTSMRQILHIRKQKEHDK